MNFGEFFRSNRRQFPFPKCIYCSMRAAQSCADCGAPMCKKHAQLDGDQFKCRAHRAQVEVAESVKGVLE